MNPAREDDPSDSSKYLIGTGSHAVAVIDGDYYDSWDSGNEIPAYFWRVR